MANGISFGVKISADGGPAAARQIAQIEQEIRKVKDANKNAADTARLLKEAYDLNDQEVRQVTSALQELERESKKAAGAGQGLQQILLGIGQGIGQSLSDTAIRSLTGALGAVKQAAADSVGTFIDVESAIKQAGVTSGAVGTPEFEALTKEIERLGIVTSKTPKEIAATAVSLSRAGFSAQETAAALEGIIRASEATGESLETVGDIVAKTLRAFGLAADQSQFVANAFVQTANSTNTSVSGLGESFQYIASAAKAADQPINDMLILLGLLGDAGIQGSQAGTNLRAALAGIQQASAGAATEMDVLVGRNKKAVESFNLINADVRNADGSLKSMLDILPILQSRLGELSQTDKELVTKAIFGIEGGNAILTLLNATPDRIALVTDQVKNLAQAGEGAAVRAGEELLKGLSGAVSLFEGSAQTLQVRAAGAFAPALEGLTRAATDVINALLEIDGLFDPLILASQEFADALAENPEILQSLTEVVIELTEQTVTLLAQGLSGIADWLQDNPDKIVQFASDLATVIEAVGGVAEGLGNLVGGLVNLSEAGERIPGVGAGLSGLWQQAEAALPFLGLLGQVNGGLERLYNLLKAAGLIQVDFESASNELSNLGSKVETLFGNLAEKYPGAAQAASQAATSVGGAATQAAADVGAAQAKTAEDAQTALEALASANSSALSQIETDSANAQAKILETGGTQEQVAAAEEEALKKRVEANRTYLADLQALQAKGGLSAEEAAKVADAIAQTEQQLAQDRIKAAQATVAAKVAAAQEEAKVVTENLKKQREASAAAAEETFTREQETQQSAFDEQQRQREEAFNDRQRSTEKAFQEQQQSDQAAFNKGQQAAEKAFQEDIQNRRDQRNREFAALNSEADRRMTLATADSAKERREIIKEIERTSGKDAAREAEQFVKSNRGAIKSVLEEDGTEGLRRFIEQGVLAEQDSILANADTSLSPLQQAQKEFEDQLKAEEALFNEQQRLQEEEFQANQKQAEEEFQAKQREDSAAFSANERQLEADFKAGQREVERLFKEEQRSLDEASAARIAQILSNAEQGIAPSQSLRMGGVAAGGVVQVHADEFLIPPRGTRVVSQAESRALVAEYLSARQVAAITVPAPVVATAPGLPSLDGIERRLDALLRAVQERPAVQAPLTQHIVGKAQGIDPAKLAAAHYRSVVRGLRL